MSALCRSCRKPIVWMRTKNGKRIPVDPDPKHPRVLDDGEFEAATMRSHFETCPHAKQHRKVEDQPGY